MTTSTAPTFPVPHPFRVRTQTSGWNGVPKFIVVQLRDGRAHRVSVHPFTTRESAQASADDLNIGAGVLPFEDDPRPYDVRHAEAAQRYLAAKATGFAGQR